MSSDKKNICIIGLGYVGLPLAVAFAKKFKVVGFDISETRIKDLKSGTDKTLEVDNKLLESVKSNITYISNIKDVKNCNIYIITVPTPIDKANRPDLKPLINASMTVGNILKKDDIVIYESTVYPGVTREVCVPELAKSSGLIFNKDFFCGYSPERISPGDKERTLTKILKVTSGSTPEIAKQIDLLYKEIILAGTYLRLVLRLLRLLKLLKIHSEM